MALSLGVLSSRMGSANAGRQDEHDPRVGRVIQDRYRIVRKIGEGGMGAVYEGEHLAIARRVAIKCLHERIGRDEKLAARFHREARAATKIGHPNIIDVLDFGSMEDGTAFMVLEYLEGKNLEDLIDEEGPQPVGRVVRIVSSVCDALKAAHAQGIVHRDLKPENLFLVRREDNPYFVKVLDFGIAKFTEADDFRLTQTGQAMGTPYYMAPEQLLGHSDVGPRADLYSLGVILFHALSDHYPFEGQTFAQLVIRVTRDPPPPLSALRPDVPAELAALVAKLLSKEPEDRPASAAELREALAPFRKIETVPPPRAGSSSGRRNHSTVETIPPVQTAPLGAMASSSDEISLAMTTPVALAPLDPSALLSRPPAARTGPIEKPIEGLPASPTSTDPDPPRAPVSASIVVPPARSRAPLAFGLIALLGAAALLAWAIAPRDDAEPIAAVDRVRVSIATEPEDATLLLDGAEVVNPFSAELPRNERHRIEARRDGYRTEVRELELRFDGQHIQLSLRPEPAEPEPAEPVPAEPALAEPAQSAPAVVPLARRRTADPPRPILPQPEPAPAEPARAEPVRAEPVRPEPVAPQSEPSDLMRVQFGERPASP
jgi:serine/threonine protein kinase